MDSVNPLIALCALLPILYVSAFAHELGHAVMAHAIGFAVTSFGLGVGRPFAALFAWSCADLFLPHQAVARHRILRAAHDHSAAPSNGPLPGRGSHRQHVPCPPRSGPLSLGSLGTKRLASRLRRQRHPGGHQPRALSADGSARPSCVPTAGKSSPFFATA